jgi:molybdate transport system substrate-binding protein
LSADDIMFSAREVPVLNARSSETAARPLRVMAAGAAKSVIEDLFAGRAASGAPIETMFDTVGALRDRVLGGDRPDILILSTEAMDALAAGGRFRQGPAADLGRTGVGLAGQRRRARASLETVEQFREVLLAAPSIGYADPTRGATAGAWFVKCLQELNLTDALRDRLKAFPFGVDAVSAVGRGEIAMAVSQATEIVPRPEVAFMGFFPEPCQIWTSYRAVALPGHPSAIGFIDVLASARGADALRRAGFT